MQVAETSLYSHWYSQSLTSKTTAASTQVAPCRRSSLCSRRISVPPAAQPPAAPSDHSRLCRDFRAGSGDGPPGPAEVNVALALDVPGLLVRKEVVERVTVVGDL